MSTSYIPHRIRFLLWGKSAGRCQYRGCNDCLYQDLTTKIEFNQAYIAHIVADKANGPRGHKTRSEKLKKDISNFDVKSKLSKKNKSRLKDLEKTYKQVVNKIAKTQKQIDKELDNGVRIIKKTKKAIFLISSFKIE